MDELETELSAVFRERPTDEWVSLLADEHGLPVGPVFDVEKALSNEQTEARETVTDLDHPTVGSVPVIEHPLNFTRAESGFEDAPPLLGEDTEAVFREAGYDDAAIDRLRDEGAIPEE
jgi:crotonobetainyl-CoA:carnitine CoA-transferase CaiB-like acyl-CoA transferase